MSKDAPKDIRVEITRLLLAAEPGLLRGDTEAAARASNILCDVLGAVLASPVFLKSGGDRATFEAVMAVLVTRITNTTISTAKEQVRIWPALTSRPQ